MFNRPAPPGFQGLRDDLPIEIYDQLLPHWRQDGATYFVTFRLADSLPQAKLQELRDFRAEWDRSNPPPRRRMDLDEIARLVFERIECWLDQGSGSCLLRKRQNAAKVIQELHDSDGIGCELGCYVVMPNHVHAIVRPLNPHVMPLEDVLRLWKGSSARGINLAQQSTGNIWQKESYDRIIRDAEHLYRVIQYIGRNPRTAGLPPGSAPLWIRPSWRQLGWDFEDLVVP